MAELVKWGWIAFYVSPCGIRGVKDIAIEAGCETEDSTAGSEKYVKRKNSSPYTISLTAILDERLGEKVQTTALQLTEAARCSAAGYFYTGGVKLLPSQFMLVSAKVSGIELLPKGKWLRCEVALTLKQCSKYDGGIGTGSSAGSGGSGGGSGGKSGGTTAAKKVSVKLCAPCVNMEKTVQTGNVTYNLHSQHAPSIPTVQQLVNKQVKTAQSQSEKILAKAQTAKTGQPAAANKILSLGRGPLKSSLIQTQ